MSTSDVTETGPNTGFATEKAVEFEDTPIVCVDCSKEFIWTVGEQVFFRDKQLQNPPKRCKPCKQLKNARLAAVESCARTGQRVRIEVSAECAECSRVTTVPFFPSQGRPVYCRSCFQKISASPNGKEA